MNLNDIFNQMAEADRLKNEVRANQELFRLVNPPRVSALDGIAKSHFAAASALKNISAQTDLITLGIAKSDSIAAAALGKIEFPSYVTTRLNDLLYPDSASALANHVLALRDQASAIGKLNFSAGALQPVMAATYQPPQAAITAHFPASITSAAYQSSNAVKELITFKAAADSQLVFKGITENVTANLFNLGAAAAFSPSKMEVISAAAAITSPWIEPANALRSFESVAGLVSIGKAISASPFSHQASKAVGELFGDWSQAKTLTAVPADWQERRDFYFEYGFDRRLTNFPEPAFTQALISTDILRPDLFSPVFPRGGDDYSRFITSVPAKESEGKEEESAQDIVKQRMLEAYDLLFNLETQLREYITEVMAEHCGPKWIKQRVPEPMRNDWNRKKQTAQEKGEEDHPLFWYADFSDYVQIIIRKDNWKDVFEKVFSNLVDLQASFYRLQPLRISTMHSRPITQEDFLLLTVETRRLLCAIGKVKK